MSSFTRLAKRVVLANRVRKQFEPLSPTGASHTHNRHIIPLPPTLTERIPQELYEHIIDYLSNDIPTLLACCMVCRAWVPGSRNHLFGRRLVVRSLELTKSRARVNCAVAIQGRKVILYGTDNGIFISQTASKSSPAPLLFSPDPITQIDVLMHYNLVVMLAGQHVLTVPLKNLNPTSPKDSSACTRISSHATFFKLGIIKGRHLLCVVKAGIASTTCKLLEPSFSHTSQSFSLQLYKEFYVSEKVLSIHFLRTKLVAGTSRHDFEIIDVETLNTQPLLDPSVTFPKARKCLAVTRVGYDVLICYSSFAAYVDTQGRLTGKEPIQWRSNTISTVVFREPYMIAVGSEHIEIRHVYTGALVQTVWISATIINTSPELPIIQAQDGRILGLQFSD